MRWGEELLEARRSAGLSQRVLAERAGTSQATVSLYERGRKQPSLAVLERLLAATGQRLQTVSARPTRAELTQAGARFADALALSEALPFRRGGALAYPRLPGP